MSIINLQDKDFLAKGGERICYTNPLNKHQIIKVLHLKGKNNKQNKLEYIYYTYLKNKKVDFSNIAQCFAWINTNKGKGLVFEKISDYDGTTSKDFRFYIRNNLLDIDNQNNLLKNLKKYLEKNLILFIDVSTVNVLCQEINKHEYKLVIIDGLGARRLGFKFYLYVYCNFLTKYKIKKQWIKFMFNYNKDKTYSN